MKAAKQLVPWYIQIAIVYLKIPVVDLVVKHPQMQPLFIAENKAFEPRVGGDGIKPVKHKMENQMHRVRGHHKMDHHSAKIKHMFHRVHRQPRPRPNIGIAVVQGVEPVK